MACAQMTQASVAPWRQRNSALSSEAAEFVPSWKETQAPPASNGNCCLISLGAYSDDSDSDSAHEEPSVVDESAMSRSRRPWRVSAPEFVPRGPANLDDAVLESFDASQDTPVTNAAGSEEQQLWWRPETPPPKVDVASNAKSPPWRRSSTPTESSVATFSTSEGSSSPAGSVDSDASSARASTASCASRSRSSTPPRPVPEQAYPFSLHVLLQFRGTATSESPREATLPCAKEPEPGTAAAAIAAYAAAEASGQGHPASGSTSVPQRRRISFETSARRNSFEDSSKTHNEEKSWRVQPEKLEVSDDSWLARQHARRHTRSSIQGDTDIMSDEDIVRSMKSILNKLTVEKFESLSVQLIHCGIQNTFHLELLIQEVFEKATTQHHFIDMYADLCDFLNIHFSEHSISDDPQKNFKKVLLHCCQASFEKHLTPPKGLAELNSEDRAVAERKYKMRMLGNIRFVGALLVRKMLASKVMLAIMEELLQDPTPEALESLAALLTVVGPTFDRPDWAYRTTLNAIFQQVERLSKKASVDSRVRCLLKDVLDLRSLDWEDRKPKKIEGPLKLEKVAAKAAMENSGWVSQKACYSGGNNGWDNVGKERLGKLCNILSSKQPVSPCATPTRQQLVTPQKVEKTTRGGNAGAAMLEFLKSRDAEPAQHAPAPQESTFDQKACKVEISATLAELRVSYDVAEAITRIANIALPAPNQAAELDDFLARVAEEGDQGARKAGFGVVAGLIREGHWQAESAAKGLRSFVEDTCPDLKFDVPALPRILREELHPALVPAVKAGFLEADLQKLLTSI